MKNLLSFLFLLFVLPLGLNAQNVDYNVHAIENVSAQRLRSAGIGTFDYRDKSVDGSFLLFDQWRPAVLLLMNDKKMKFDYFNYNLKENQALLKLDDGDLIALPLREFQSFLVTDIDMNESDLTKERSFLRLATEQRELKLLELLADGEWGLYRHHSLVIKKANYNAALDQGSVQDQARKKAIFYLKYDGKLMELPSNRKKAINTFSRYKKITNYLQKNKVNMKNEEELVELLNYLNNKK